MSAFKSIDMRANSVTNMKCRSWGVILGVAVLLLAAAVVAPGIGSADTPIMSASAAETTNESATTNLTLVLNRSSSVVTESELAGQVTLRTSGDRAVRDRLVVRADGSVIHRANVTLDANDTQSVPITYTTPAAAGQLTVTATYADTQAETTVTVEDAPPTADIDTPTTTATVGSPTTFEATESDDNDEIVKYSWCFGDGECGLGMTETHTYDAPGTYNVTLTVTDSAGQRDTTSRMITVSGGREPTAHLECTPSVLVAGETVSCDASGSSDDGSIATYEWRFSETRDDGTTSTRTIHRGSGVSEDFTYDSPGVYAVHLTVVDDEGNTDTTQRAITVEPAGAAPEAALQCSPTDAAVGQPVDCVAAGSRDDDFLTNYTWHFGDGTTATGDFQTHTYDRPGAYRVSLTVTDISGLTDTTTQVVSVAPTREPNAVMSCSPTTTQVGDRVACTATTSNDDAEIVSYNWAFGDGARGQGSSAEHTYDETGVYPITLTVVDEDGHTDTTRRDVTVTDDPIPVADFTYRPKPPSPETTLQLNASASFDRQSSIVRYEWDLNGDGSVDATGPQTTHSFDAGPQVVTLTVIDAEGYRSSTEQLLTVTSDGETQPTTQSAQPVDRSPPSDDGGVLLNLRMWALLGGLILSLIGLSYRRLA